MTFGTQFAYTLPNDIRRGALVNLLMLVLEIVKIVEIVMTVMGNKTLVLPVQANLIRLGVECLHVTSIAFSIRSSVIVWQRRQMRS